MLRKDGRKFDQLRQIKITRDFIKHAKGSCLIEFGDTRVICAATFEKAVPLFLKGSGKGWVTAEYGMLPASVQNRIERNKVFSRHAEIKRLIGRSLRSIVDLSALGEKTIKVDCDVIQADGGTRTASIVGGFIALADCFLKLRDEAEIIDIPLKGFLGAISVGIWEGNLILDLNYSEDSSAEVDMNIVMKGDGEIVEIQGTAEKKPFNRDELNEMISLAEKGINEIIEKEKEMFKGSLFNF